MSEQDLQLKASIRRLFWRMGFSTRVDVPLRAYVPKKGDGPSAEHEEFTDLDVLGLALGPDFRLQSLIADCKTTQKRSTERMFWLRGVADFFSADNSYLVRATDVTAAARQLAARLGISIVTPPDLAALEESHTGGTTLDNGPLDFLFDPTAIATSRKRHTEVDSKLSGLLEYRQFDYWVYEPHRNLQQVVAHLTDARRHLKPNNPIHFSIFLDYAWLQTLAIAGAVQHIRRAHLVQVDSSLQEYLFGGQLGLREKEQLAAILRKVAGRGEAKSEGVLPPYYSGLLELTTRFLRRPEAIGSALRYGEALSESVIAGSQLPTRELFKEEFDEVAAKLYGDVCSFLVAAAGLPAEFRTKSRDLVSYESSDVSTPPQASPKSQNAAVKDASQEKLPKLEN